MVIIPKKMIITPEMVLSCFRDHGVMVVSTQPLVPANKSHQKQEPKKRPEIRVSISLCVVSVATSSAAKSAAKERISRGLVSVKKKVEKYACAMVAVQVCLGPDTLL